MKIKPSRVVVFIGDGFEKGSVNCSNTPDESCCKWLMDSEQCPNCPMAPYTLRCDSREEYNTLFPHSPFETEVSEEGKEIVCINSLKQE